MGEEARLTQEFEIKTGNLNRAGDVSIQVKTLLKGVGFPSDVIRRASIACYEAEMNVVMYSEGGTLRLSVSPSCIAVTIEDRGPGIPDIELAMQEGFSTAKPEHRELGFGAGMGLPNIRRNTDGMELSSEVGVGTVLKFKIDPNKTR